jgi:hypothetical protein
MGRFLYYPKFRAFNANGTPLALGTVETFVTGTNTPLATYSDAALSSANTNPVELDANGEAWIFLANGGKYRIVVKDSAGATVWSQDGINGDGLGYQFEADSLKLGNVPTITTGTASPEGVVTAPIGSLFLRQDGSTSTTLYVKTAGAGDTGWTAK